MTKLTNAEEVNNIIKELCESVDVKETIDVIDVKAIVLKHKKIYDVLFHTSRIIMCLAVKEGYFKIVAKKTVRDGKRLRNAYLRTDKEFEVISAKRTTSAETAVEYSNETGLELFKLFGIDKPDVVDLKKVNCRKVSQASEFGNTPFNA